MRLKLFQGGLSIIAILVLANCAFGCTCMDVEPTCQAFGRASAVFAGTVTGVRTAPQSKSGKSEDINWTRRTFKFSIDIPFLGVAGT